MTFKSYNQGTKRGWYMSVFSLCIFSAYFLQWNGKRTTACLIDIVTPEGGFIKVICKKKLFKIYPLFFRQKVALPFFGHKCFLKWSVHHISSCREIDKLGWQQVCRQVSDSTTSLGAILKAEEAFSITSPTLTCRHCFCWNGFRMECVQNLIFV